MNAIKGDVVESATARRIKVLGDIAAIRVQIVREPFDWALVEREPGQFDFTFYDSLVAEAARNGLRVLPILEDPPDWRSTRPDGVERRIMYPPKSNAEMASWAFAMASRYGPGGSCRASRRPPLPIVSWQVWNEPNIPVFWGQQPNAAEYTDLLAKVTAAIRQVQPQAEIVTAGLTYSPLGPTAPTFLEDMYRAGAAGTFDTLAVHPYSRDDRTVAALIGDARAVLDEHRDGAKIWVTEFGWGTGDPSKPHGHTEQQQAQLIGDTIVRLGTARQQLGIRGFDYFYWAETAPPSDPSQEDPIWSHVGLLRYGDQPKLGFFAFRDTVANLLDGRIPPDPGPYRQDPVRIGRLRVAPKRFASARWAQVATRRRPRGSLRARRGGSELTFRANRTGMVLVTVERTRHGHLSRLGTARLVVYEGRNRVLLSGSVHGRALRPGPYRVRVRDAGGHGRWSTVGFQIVRPASRRR